MKWFESDVFQPSKQEHLPNTELEKEKPTTIINPWDQLRGGRLVREDEVVRKGDRQLPLSPTIRDPLFYSIPTNQ